MDRASNGHRIRMIWKMIGAIGSTSAGKEGTDTSMNCELVTSQWEKIPLLIELLCEPIQKGEHRSCLF